MPTWLNGRAAALFIDFTEVKAMNETKQKGLLTELQCQLAFSKLGTIVSQPIMEDSRYDFLVDLGKGHILRIQCKTCRIEEDKRFLEFSTRSSNSHINNCYNKEEIDYFYTYLDGKSYLIPVEECSTEKKLWFVLPKNGQVNLINFAKNYELEKILFEKEGFEGKKVDRVIISTEEKSEKRCSNCGLPISKKAILCEKCSHISSRKVERPSREELKDLIYTTSFVKIGEKFHVSDNTIRKWCKYYNLPFQTSEIKNISKEEWSKI